MAEYVDPGDLPYKAVVPSAWLNQVLENTRAAWDLLTKHETLPHARVRHTAATAGIAANTWTTVPMNTAPADGGGSRQPWTIGADGFTINETGLYLVTINTSMDNPDFVVRVLNTTPEPDVVLAQGKEGRIGDASLSDTLSFSRRLLAGDKLVWQVYKRTTGAMAADATVKPCFFDVVRLSS